jgi:hypothetical protein
MRLPESYISFAITRPTRYSGLLHGTGRSHRALTGAVILGSRWLIVKLFYERKYQRKDCYH